MKMTQNDLIIAELRAVRERQAARFDYDMVATFRDIRSAQEASSRDYVRYPARRLDFEKQESSPS